MNNNCIITNNNLIQCDGQILFLETIIFNIVNRFDKKVYENDIIGLFFIFLFTLLFISHFTRLLIKLIIANMIFYLNAIIFCVIKTINKMFI